MVLKATYGSIKVPLMSHIFLSTLNQNKHTVSKGNQQKDDNQCEKQSEI